MHRREWPHVGCLLWRKGSLCLGIGRRSRKSKGYFNNRILYKKKFAASANKASSPSLEMSVSANESYARNSPTSEACPWACSWDLQKHFAKLCACNRTARPAHPRYQKHRPHPVVHVKARAFHQQPQLLQFEVILYYNFL